MSGVIVAELHELLSALADADGVSEVNVQVTVTPKVRLRQTGVSDDFHTMRERVAKPAELEAIADEHGFTHAADIDQISDFAVRDRIRQRTTIEL
jgi:hypothetical protein